MQPRRHGSLAFAPEQTPLVLPIGAARRTSADAGYVTCSIAHGPSGLAACSTSPAVRCTVSPNVVPPASLAVASRSPPGAYGDASPNPPSKLDAPGGYAPTSHASSGETLEHRVTATSHRAHLRPMPPKPPLHALPGAHASGAIAQRVPSEAGEVGMVAAHLLPAAQLAAPQPGERSGASGTVKQLAEAFAARKPSGLSATTTAVPVVACTPTPTRAQRPLPTSAAVRWVPGTSVRTAAPRPSLSATTRATSAASHGAATPRAAAEGRCARRGSSVAVHAAPERAVADAVALLRAEEEPRPRLACTPSCIGALSWEVEKKSHPLVTDGEKTFVVACLEELSRMVEEEGGLRQFAQPDCVRRLQLVSPAKQGGGGEEPGVVLLPAFEALLQREARNGGDTIFIEPGSILSLGSKKVLKVRVSCDHADILLSVCWDWDVRLEPRTGEA